MSFKILKYRLKIFLYPITATLLNIVGFSWKTIGNTRLSVFTPIAQLKQLFDNVEINDRNNKKLDIIFLTMIGNHFFTINVEILLGLILKKRGHRVRFVIDDQVLPITEHHLIGQEKDWESVSSQSYLFGKKYLSKLNLETIFL